MSPTLKARFLNITWIRESQAIDKQDFILTLFFFQLQHERESFLPITSIICWLIWFITKKMYTKKTSLKIHAINCFLNHCEFFINIHKCMTPYITTTYCQNYSSAMSGDMSRYLNKITDYGSDSTPFDRMFRFGRTPAF